MRSTVIRRSIFPILLLLVAIFLIFFSRVSAQEPDSIKWTVYDSSRYIVSDLKTGEKIYLLYDTVNWVSKNRVTSVPIDYYIIGYPDGTKPADTIHGITGLIVNGMLTKNSQGQWMFNDARVKWDGKELKIKDAYGRVIRWENGNLKIKEWNSKYKSDKPGEAKLTGEWNTIKWRE